eukprot:SAG31_NODE_1319_length_8817_cov_1.857077_8_plen_72_part_00
MSRTFVGAAQCRDKYKDASFFLTLETILQYLNYLSLLSLFAPVDNAWHRIKTVCQLLQAYQAIEIFYDICL